MNIADKLSYKVFSYTNVGRNHNITPIQLHFASQFNYTTLAKYLIYRGVDVNTRDDNGYTPLHIASICGNTKIVKYLLKHTVDISVQDNSGPTPLGEGVQYDNTYSDTGDHYMLDDISIYGDQTPLLG